MTRPTLSVLMPNYNHSRFLRESIAAILDQSYRPDEFIILDDASTDNSYEILEEFAAREPLLKIIRHDSNRGVVYCMNSLLSLSSGDYVSFTASDDRICSRLYERSMNLLRNFPEAALCSSLVMRINADGKNLGLLPVPMVSEQACYFSSEDVARLLGRWGAWFQTFSAIFRRQVLLQNDGFDPQLGPYSDSFLCEIMALKHGACFVPECLAAWRKLDGGFAATTASDGETARAYIDRAVSIISSDKYKGLFPTGYAEHYRRRKLFALGFDAVERVQEVVNNRLDALFIALPEQRSIDAVVVRLFRLFVRLWGYALEAYLLLRNFDPALVRSILSWARWKARLTQRCDPRGECRKLR